MSAPSINCFIWGIPHGVLRDACDQDTGQDKRNVRCRMIHNEPHPLRTLIEIRAGLLVVNRESEGLHVEIAGGTA